MRKSRFREERIIGILQDHQAGIGTKELCRKHRISDGTFHKWRSRYGGMEGEPSCAIGSRSIAAAAKRLKALGAENAKHQEDARGSLA